MQRLKAVLLARNLCYDSMLVFVLPVSNLTLYKCLQTSHLECKSKIYGCKQP